MLNKTPALPCHPGCKKLIFSEDLKTRWSQPGKSQREKHSKMRRKALVNLRNRKEAMWTVIDKKKVLHDEVKRI